MGLEVVRRKVSELISDPGNTRAHSAVNLGAIRASLEKFGQVEPLVVRRGTGVVIGGNGRLAVMVAMGLQEVDVVEVDLTDAQASALSIALNRSGELAEWDQDALARAVKAAQGELDLARLGWDEHILKAMDGVTWQPDAVGELPSRVDMGEPVALTEAQSEVFDAAVKKIREENGNHITEGRAAELMAADYLAGA